MTNSNYSQDKDDEELKTRLEALKEDVAYDKKVIASKWDIILEVMAPIKRIKADNHFTQTFRETLRKA